jgi:spermidine/putrescine transport system ATP-binding protein
MAQEALSHAAARGPAVEAQADIRLVHVSKAYGDITALRPTELDIGRGQFFSLLGASGSGKTTTLRIIAGFEEPTTGRVYLQDRDVTSDPPYERNVNTVFQDYALFPHMNVADNIAYGLRVRRVRKSEIRRRVSEALELVRLTGYDRRRPSQLSGGQRQRVALARALINVPAVLLLDEPLGALDLKLRREMQVELKRIQRDVGITFLYVTHDQEEAMSMSDRIAVMHEGRIVQIGTPTDVYERPASAFIAGFLGMSNVIQGTVAERSGGRCRLITEAGESIVFPCSEDLARGETAVVTFRPEKLRMARSEPASYADINCLNGRITDLSYGGPTTRYTVDTGDREVIVVEQNEGTGPRAGLGDAVWISWQPEQTHVLPGSLGELQDGRRVAATE